MKIKIEIEIEVSVIDEETQLANGNDPDLIFDDGDIDAHEIAQCIADSLPLDQEMFGGSEIWVTIDKARVLSAASA